VWGEQRRGLDSTTAAVILNKSESVLLDHVSEFDWINQFEFAPSKRVYGSCFCNSQWAAERSHFITILSF